jgi:hypothetical protein
VVSMIACLLGALTQLSLTVVLAFDAWSSSNGFCSALETGSDGPIARAITFFGACR